MTAALTDPVARAELQERCCAAGGSSGSSDRNDDDEWDDSASLVSKLEPTYGAGMGS